MRYLITATILILFLGITSFDKESKQAKKYLIKVFSQYEKIEKYSLSLKYKLYRQNNRKDIIQNYESDFLKSKNNSYRKMADIEMFVVDSTLYTIDKELKEIQISKTKTYSVIDFKYKDFFKVIDDVKILPIDDKYLLTLFVADENSIPFSRIAVLVNKSLKIEKIVYHYASQMNFGSFYNPDYDLPILEVKFENFEEITKDIPMERLAKYISFSDNKIINNAEALGYKLLDVRPKM